MERFKSVDEILNFAIAREEEAAQFYTMLAGKMSSDELSRLFNGFAKEEKAHKAKLEKVKDGTIGLVSPEKITDLKIGDYLVEPEATEDMRYQDALILAMKREKSAFKLYMDLSNIAETEDLRNLFLALAQEEAKHKLRFEIEYDDNVLAEN